MAIVRHGFSHLIKIPILKSNILAIAIQFTVRKECQSLPYIRDQKEEKIYINKSFSQTVINFKNLKATTNNDFLRKTEYKNSWPLLRNKGVNIFSLTRSMLDVFFFSVFYKSWNSIGIKQVLPWHKIDNTFSCFQAYKTNQVLAFSCVTLFSKYLTEDGVTSNRMGNLERFLFSTVIFRSSH